MSALTAAESSEPAMAVTASARAALRRSRKESTASSSPASDAHVSERAGRGADVSVHAEGSAMREVPVAAWRMKLRVVGIAAPAAAWMVVRRSCRGARAVGVLGEGEGEG